MKNLSVKTKTLIILTSISLVGLLSFGYMSYDRYNNDKLSFVFDQILSQTATFAETVKLRMDKYDLLLGTVITQLDEGKLELRSATKSYIESQPTVHVVGLKIKDDLKILSQKSEIDPEIWNKVKDLSPGIHAVNLDDKMFVYKRSLTKLDGYAYVVFRDLDLYNMLSSSNLRATAIVTQEGAITNSSWENFENILVETRKHLPDLNKVSSSSSKITLLNKPYLLSHVVIEGYGYVVSLHDYDGLMIVQKQFVQQLFAFLSLMVFVSMLVGTYASEWLTKNLRQLQVAAQQIGEEKFDFEVNIKSGDEFEVVGNAFSSMGLKIKTLLDELRRYNTQLEEMVAERTRELQELTNIQKTMLNALGQGFVMIDRDKKVSPVFSKIAIEMFDKQPDQVNPLDIMSVKDEEKPMMEEFIDHVFNENVDFDTFVQLAPGRRSNTKDQKIFLEYAPIRNEESNKLDYFLVIGTDRTEELESKEKFEREWKFSQMILAMAKNREALCKTILDSFRMLEECQKLARKGSASYLEIQRRVHTIKGSFSFYHIDKVTSLANDFESSLEAPIKQGTVAIDVDQRILWLTDAIESVVNEFDEIIKYKLQASGRYLDEASIKEFEAKLGKEMPALGEVFHEMVYRVDIKSEFNTYPRVVKEIGEKLGKQVHFSLGTTRPTFPEGPWMQVLPELVHVVRNAVDHGLERPEERSAHGKSPQGEIKFLFDLVGKGHGTQMFITLSDDGKGIDVEKLKQKFPDVTDYASAIKKIALGGASTRDEVSEFSGRGVGVSAVIQKVLALGGRWEIDSTLGKGTTIKLWIPVKEQKLISRAA